VPYKNIFKKIMVAGAMGFLYGDPEICFYMEDDAVGMVLRLALKTRFS
jgi:hypothetical protein